jgi:tripartite-type tricarboxylate transporter receptor subunit TctC
LILFNFLRMRRVGTGAVAAVMAVMIAAAVTTAVAARAAPFPAKPIRLVTPYPPGGGTDAVARPIAQSFSKAWGQPVVVDNRGSGGGVIAAQMVAQAPPDGYTLFMANSAVMLTAPMMMTTVTTSAGFDPYKDFAPVGLATTLPAFLICQTSTPAHNVQDVIAMARATPGKLSFSSSGAGGGGYLSVELLKNLAKLDIINVPYKGGGPAIVALLSGEVQFTFGNYTAARPHLQAGRVKAIAVASARRTVLMPQIPTLIEAGLADFEYSSWYAFYYPAKTPRTLIDQVNAELRKTLADKTLIDYFLQQGAETTPSSPEALHHMMRAEERRWGSCER